MTEHKNIKDKRRLEMMSPHQDIHMGMESMEFEEVTENSRHLFPNEHFFAVSASGEPGAKCKVGGWHNGLNGDDAALMKRAFGAQPAMHDLHYDGHHSYLIEASVPSGGWAVLERVNGLSETTYTHAVSTVSPDPSLCLDAVDRVGGREEGRRITRWRFRHPADPLPAGDHDSPIRHYYILTLHTSPLFEVDRLTRIYLSISQYERGGAVRIMGENNATAFNEALLARHFGPDYIDAIYALAMELYTGSKKGLAYRLANLLPQVQERSTLIDLLQAQSYQAFAQMTAPMTPDWFPPMQLAHTPYTASTDSKSGFALRYAIMTRCLANERLTQLQALLDQQDTSYERTGSDVTRTYHDALSLFASMLRDILRTQDDAEYWSKQRTRIYRFNPSPHDLASTWRSLPLGLLDDAQRRQLIEQAELSGMISTAHLSPALSQAQQPQPQPSPPSYNIS